MTGNDMFGDVIHAEGAYVHNLDPYWEEYQGNWRYDFNSKHRGDVYATHGMGPACQVLNIHRGDKMNLLVSMDTDAFNGKKLSQRISGNEDGEAYVSDKIRDALMEQYQHPITREGSLVETAKRVGGHGGMDFIMDYRLVYCLRNGLPLDQDVYDAAEWSCLGELSRMSIENGCIPVIMPDFTRGDWNVKDGLELSLK